MHRRLNLLLYLSPEWKPEWGGDIQLWDETVKNCEASFSPKFNRCVIFETNEISYHGVVPVSPSAPGPRQSFATYYYTREAPAHWTGVRLATVWLPKAKKEMRYLLIASYVLVVIGITCTFLVKGHIPVLKIIAIDVLLPLISGSVYTMRVVPLRSPFMFRWKYIEAAPLFWTVSAGIIAGGALIDVYPFVTDLTNKWPLLFM